jgi:hypothetical protein
MACDGIADWNAALSYLLPLHDPSFLPTGSSSRTPTCHHTTPHHAGHGRETGYKGEAPYR